MMFMLLHVFMNSSYLSSAQYSSTRINLTFLSWFLNLVKRNLRVSRGGRLLLGGNPEGYELAEHIATKFEVNPLMLLTLKKQIHLKHEPRVGGRLIHKWLDLCYI